MKKIFFLLSLALGLMITSCGDKCDDVNCGTNGTCVEGVCDCDEGYSGTNCEINICDNSACENGDCNPVTGECTCDEGYSGINCEINICDTTPCDNGDCNPTTGECTCNEGYEGDACDTEIRAKFLGTWSTDAWNCDGFSDDAEFVIKEHTGILEVLLTDDDEDFCIKGVISGNQITFPFQIVDEGTDTSMAEGMAILNADGTLDVSFDVIADDESFTCAGLFTM